MKKLITRTRSLVLVAALAAMAAMCTVSTANAASLGGGAVGVRGAAHQTTAASSTPCTINYLSTTCQSTNHAVTVDNYFSGDQSGCSYVSSVTWGDGQSTTNVLYTDPGDGYDLLGTHTYAAANTYTISVTLELTAGDCTANGFTAQFTLLVPPPAVTCPSASEPSLVKQPNYAGYSIYRARNCMTEVTGTWTVPSISCPSKGQPGYSADPRVAIWAGLWGTDASVKANTAWLPQIGVTGQCDSGHLVYYADWEMMTNVHGGGALTCGDCGSTTPIGAAPQCLVNPADTLTYLRTFGRCLTLGTLLSNYPQFEVRAGDKVTADVTYNGLVTSGPDTGDLDFDLSLTNDTLAPGSNAVASFPDVITTMPVNLENIIGQGGLIVENNTNGALAKFSPAIPLQFNGWKATGSGPYHTSQWQMWVSGNQLTNISPSLSPQHTFKVSYKSSG
jgi:hypothetical protein